MVVLLLSSFFIGAALFSFIIAATTDPRIKISAATLTMAAQQFPNSAAVHTRLAARLVEGEISKSERHEEVGQEALKHSLRAVQLAPLKYEGWVLLSAARELAGDLRQAERDLRKALALAPQRTMLHWRLANLLLREEDLAAALAEFRIATSADASLLLPTIRMLWQATNGDWPCVASVVNKKPASQLIWANFLVEQSQASPAVDVFSRIDQQTLLKLPGSNQLLNNLITAQEFVQADRGWQHLFGQRADNSLLWNGSFELVPHAGFNQFDWQLSESRYARIGLTSSQTRTGKRALSLEYLGIETTRLDMEIRQLVIVRANHRYRLEGYAKPDSFVTTEGPRIVVTALVEPTIIAETAMVHNGSSDWQRLTTDFTAPAGTSALLITIKQTPRYSYAAPTRGTVWFDDLTLQEQ
jgi:tetratricopeptide (TPR) repeat protein